MYSASRRLYGQALIVEGLHPAATGAAHLAGTVGVVEERPDGAGQRRGVAGRHEQAGLPRHADLARAALVGRHDRHAARHGLEEHEPERLGLPRRQHQDVQGPAHRGHVGRPVAPAGEPHDTVETEARREALEVARVILLSGDGAAHDDEPGRRHVVAQAGRGLEKDVDALPGVEPAHHAHQRRRVGLAQVGADARVRVARTKRVEVDAVRHDPHVGCERAGRVAEQRSDGVARHDDAVGQAREAALQASHQTGLPDDLADVPDVRAPRDERDPDAVQVVDRVGVHEVHAGAPDEPGERRDRERIVQREAREVAVPTPARQLRHARDDCDRAPGGLESGHERAVGRQRHDRTKPRSVEPFDEAHERHVRSTHLRRGVQVENVTRPGRPRVA